MTVADITISLDQTAPIVIEFDGGMQPTIVVEEQPAILINIPGTQGLSGPPGDGGVELPAAASLSAYSAVAVASAGELVHASCDNLAHALAVAGLITAACPLGDMAVVSVHETIDNPSWSWVSGPVMLGLDGQLTQVLPVGATFAQTIGRGEGTRLVLNLQPPLLLN